MHISKALSLSTKICYAGDRPIWGKSDSGLNQGNFCLWNLESWVFQCGIHLKLWRIRNPLTIGIQNPSATDKGWNPVPGIRNSWRGIQNPSLSWIPLELVLERSSIFSFPHSPLPCACGQKIPPPGFYFRTRARPSQKRKSEVLWTGYRNSSYFFVAGCCISIVLCVLLSHDSRVSRARYFGSCVALACESPIFHRASEILRRAWKSPPVRMGTCWPAQPGILPWGKMWGEGGGHTWISPIRPSSVTGKTNTNWNLFVKLMIIYRLNKIRKRLSIHPMPCESDRDVGGGIVQS